MEKEKENKILSTNSIFDDTTRTHYIKGKKLGSGGFGNVYEFTEINSQKIYAGKIIPLNKIDSNLNSRISFLNETSLNHDINFEYICKCYSTFKDHQNAYFLLDFCPNRTLSELLAERGTLSEFEVKHYGYQLLLAIEYLHTHNIIHRDLKLSNILLTSKMEVRLCDFGLAIRSQEGNQVACGTPNYIAPEVLKKKINTLNTYGFEVDIWSFGVIIYSLLFHKTPFEGDGNGKTQVNIINVNYSFPDNINVSNEAKRLIEKILVKNPENRPSIKEIKCEEFFNNGINIPKYLPTSTLKKPLTEEEIENIIIEANEKKETMNLFTPNFKSRFSHKIRDLDSFNGDDDSDEGSLKKKITKGSQGGNKEHGYTVVEGDKKIKEIHSVSYSLRRGKVMLINSNNNNNNDNSNNNNNHNHNHNNSNSESNESNNNNSNSDEGENIYYKRRKSKNSTVRFGKKLDFNNHLIDQKESYNCFSYFSSNQNFTILEKFFDISDRYGLCYLLTNGNTGVYFNDSTKIILLKSSYYFYYIDKKNSINQYSTQSYPLELTDKVKLLELFHKNLIKNVKNKETFNIDPNLNPKHLDVFVKKWEKTKFATFFLLSNKVIQVVFNDKTEIHFFLNDKIIYYIDKTKKKLREKFPPDEEYKNVEMNRRFLYAKKFLGSRRD